MSTSTIISVKKIINFLSKINKKVFINTLKCKRIGMHSLNLEIFCLDVGIMTLSISLKIYNCLNGIDNS